MPKKHIIRKTEYAKKKISELAKPGTELVRPHTRKVTPALKKARKENLAPPFTKKTAKVARKKIGKKQLPLLSVPKQSHLSYKAASQTPKKGWKYAEGDHTQASASRIVATKLGMKPEIVYNYGNKYGVNWFELLKMNNGKVDRDYFIAILNEWSLEKAKKELKK